LDHSAAFAPTSSSLRPRRSPVEIFLDCQANHHTERAFAQALRRAAGVLFGPCEGTALDDLPWQGIRYDDIELLKARLVERYSIATTNVTLAAVRGLLRHCRRLRLISPEDFDDIRDVRRASGGSLPAGRALSDAELARVFAEARRLPSPLRERDLALLAIAFTTGARRAEIAALDVADYSSTELVLTLRTTKGRRPRHVQLTADAAPHLDAWMRHRGSEPGPLLWPVGDSKRLRVGRLSSASIYRRLRVLSCRAGMRPCSPHDARRTVATRLLAAGADLGTVARQTGHASLDVLRIYDRRGDEALRRAVDRSLKLPPIERTWPRFA
jgi:integrase